MEIDAITVVKTGTTISFGAASVNTTIPTTSASTPARYIRLAATQACYVRVGNGAQTAVAGDLLVQPADSVILAVRNCNNIAALQVTTGGVLQISPLDDDA